MASRTEDRVAAARAELYAGDPAGFTGRRTELAREARADGDRAAATAIGGLRKPSAAASLVNRWARAEPEAAQQLRDLGQQFRRAATSLDADTLRDLATQRRQLVDALVRQVAQVHGSAPSEAVRQEVVGTFNAAIADDAVADLVEQGVLERAAEWSGSFADAAPGPNLTLVHSVSAPAEDAPPRRPGGARTTIGGRRAPGRTAEPDAPDALRRDDGAAAASARATLDEERRRRKEEAAQARRRREEQAAARVAVVEADRAVRAATTAHRDRKAAVTMARKRLAEVQRDVDEAERAFAAAQDALDRAQRELREARDLADRLR
ncbi:hypothetical protein [Nakamurella endophytica]|uniref:Uncharacterized protein n=1 Tax=Nakamurella endophytica TaxID=1748367 RepID=A0A917SXK4_9ACTN|nr:hypothetical protein [Nakamurella endophytica]GGL99817.1 hypothetical protein GCM10011594_19720 [Nakamurella endophytica]